ncbi:MAG: hypothetical protein K6T83_15050 [Alicyclobacillus sp.]|nr:hypothetical protein [Alicyclobacillus sp.]
MRSESCIPDYAREMGMSYDAALAFLARRKSLEIAASLIGLGDYHGAEPPRRQVRALGALLRRQGYRLN